MKKGEKRGLTLVLPRPKEEPPAFIYRVRTSRPPSRSGSPAHVDRGTAGTRAQALGLAAALAIFLLCFVRRRRRQTTRGAGGIADCLATAVVDLEAAVVADDVPKEE